MCMCMLAIVGVDVHHSSFNGVGEKKFYCNGSGSDRK